LGVRPALHRCTVGRQGDQIVTDGGNLLDQVLTSRVLPAPMVWGWSAMGPSMRSRVAD
jgi:hypothetical protein